MGAIFSYFMYLEKFALIFLNIRNTNPQKMVATVSRCYTNPLNYAQENYYTEGESFTNAEWMGKAAQVQGLNGRITKSGFARAYSSLDPQSNPLRTQQQYKKSLRRRNRPGTDVTLSAPKSVSVAALVYRASPTKAKVLGREVREMLSYLFPSNLLGLKPPSQSLI